MRARVRRYLLKALVLGRQCESILREGVWAVDEPTLARVGRDFEHLKSFLDTDSLVDKAGAGVYFIDPSFIGRDVHVEVTNPLRPERLVLTTNPDFERHSHI
jgi:hypothetical protein